MKRISVALAAGVTLALLALPSLASAAVPQKGVLVKGTLHKASLTALEKSVDLKVASTGKTARFTWWCGTPKTISNRYSLTVPIKPDGSFAGTNSVGSLTVWTLKGRFVTPTSARASLRLVAICDAKGGLANLKSS